MSAKAGMIVSRPIYDIFGRKNLELAIYDAKVE